MILTNTIVPLSCMVAVLLGLGRPAPAWAENENKENENKENEDRPSSVESSAAASEASDSPGAPAVGQDTEETEDTSDLLQILESSAKAAVGTGQTGSYGRRLQRYGVSPYLHGYVGFEVKRPAGEGERFNFDMHHFILNVGVDIAERVVPEIGLEFEHGLETMYLTLAQVDVVAVRDFLIVRAGLFSIPVGCFNEYGYPDFLRLSVARPAVLTHVVPALWTDAGIQLRGRFAWSELRNVNYALYAVNGLRQDDDLATAGVEDGGDIREMRGIARGHEFRDTTNDSKAFGGRLGLDIDEWVTGVSGYTGAYTADGKQRLTIVDVDIGLRWAKLRVDAEFAIGLQERGPDPSTGDKRSSLHKLGFFVAAGYRVLPWLQPVVLYDMVRLDGDLSEDSDTVTFGCNIYPFPIQVSTLVIKLQGEALRDRMGTTTYGGRAQLAVAF